MRTRDARVDALRRVPLLAGLSRRDAETLLALGKEEEYRPGDVIVKVGDLACDFYLILHGQAKVTVPGRRTARLGPGEYFGEMSVLDGGPRSAAIVAETKVATLRIARRDFLTLLDTHGPIGRKLLVELSKRVRAAERSTGRD